MQRECTAHLTKSCSSRLLVDLEKLMKYLWLLFPLVLSELLAEDPARIAPWNGHVKAAQELERQGNIPGAEIEFRLAAAGAQRNGSGSAAFANALDAMGVFYDRIGNFVEAENCLTRSLAIWRSLLGAEHAAIASVINQLAALYLETGQIAKAERLDLESWIHRAKANDPTGYDRIHLIEHLAALQSMRGQFVESDGLYRQALDLLMERGASRSAEQAVALNNLGVVCLRSRRFDAAIEHLSRSLEIWTEVRGPGAPNTGMTSHSLAIAYQAVGRYDEAEPLLKKALAIAEKSFGPTSLRTAAVLDSYARFLRERKRTSEARRMESRMRQIMAEAGPGLPSRHTVDVTELSLRGEQ